MNEHLAGALVRLHSRSWRDRYGAECHALLLDLPARHDVVIDCVGNALASRFPKHFDVVLTAIACVAVLVFFGASLHRTAEVRGSNPGVSVSRGPEETSIGVRRRLNCYVAADQFPTRVRCA